MVGIFYKKMFGSLSVGITFGYNWDYRYVLYGQETPVSEIKGDFSDCRIIPMFYIFTPFDYQGPEASITEFFCRPTSSHSATNYNCIKTMIRR